MVQLSAVFQNFYGRPEENWLNLRWCLGYNWNSGSPDYKEGILVNETCLCSVN